MITHLSKRFANDSIHAQAYLEFLNEYEQLGYMKLSDSQAEPQLLCYLSHHGVIRKTSSTTKLRVVFNGSSHQYWSFTPVLNDLLHIETKLQIDVFDVQFLIWFRSFQYVFSSDIEKIYRIN